jgi:hypothetical protein
VNNRLPSGLTGMNNRFWKHPYLLGTAPLSFPIDPEIPNRAPTRLGWIRFFGFYRSPWPTLIAADPPKRRGTALIPGGEEKIPLANE